MKYECNNLFMVRTPSLPVHVFSDFLRYEGEGVEDFLRQNDLERFMDQSILLASRALSDAKMREGQNRKKHKAKERSLLKYLIRAATRATPYGLFAGAAMGKFCQSGVADQLILEEDKAVLAYRVDHGWLFHWIYTMEKDPNVYPQLQVRFNPNCYISGDRLKNPHYSNHGFAVSEEGATQWNHIRNTPLIAYLRQAAEHFVNYTALVGQIQERYPGVPEEQIIATLNRLLEHEILFTNLRAPADAADSLGYVLQVLDSVTGIDQQKAELRELHGLMRQMSRRQVSDPINVDHIEKIYALQERLLGPGKEKDLLSVDKGLVLRENTLPEEVKTAIEAFVEGLSCLDIHVPSRLERFKQQFQEEYGTEVEVPLCQVIDQNVFDGLAYLAGDQERSAPNHREKQIHQIVDEKIQDCLRSRGEAVILSAQDFSKLGPGEGNDFSASFDINFVVTKGEAGYVLTLAPAGGSLSAGDMFNRFAPVLDEKDFTQYKQNNQQAPSDPAVVLVELREGSTRGRLHNINNRGQEHDYCIALATNLDHAEREIPLEDFLLGLQNGQLYLKSKSLGRRCRVVHDCMINRQTLSAVSQLLLYASEEASAGPLAGAYQLFGNEYVFLPRIIFEGVVVHPKRWTLPAHLFDLDTLEAFVRSLAELRQKYQIDEIVYLAELDNRLMLDLNKSYFQEILYQTIRKNQVLHLEELEQNLLAGNVCRDTRGQGYVTEISCSMLCREERKTGVVLDPQVSHRLEQENSPLFLLQEGWIYGKLYRMDDRENQVLQEIAGSLDHIGNPDFFYLRYSDQEGRHLRVRFKYPDEGAAQKHLLDLQKLFQGLRTRRLLHKVQFDLYFRENNRYGGSQLIPFAEAVFFEDSRFVIQLLREFQVDTPQELERAYLLGIVTILNAFFARQEDMLRQVRLVPLLEEHKKTFQKNKKTYRQRIQPLFAQADSGLGEETQRLLLRREAALKRYCEKLDLISPLTNTKENIIGSVIHMFCNRLAGDRGLEQKYLNLIGEALSDQLERDKRLHQKEV